MDEKIDSVAALLERVGKENAGVEEEAAKAAEVERPYLLHNVREPAHPYEQRALLKEAAVLRTLKHPGLLRVFAAAGGSAAAAADEARAQTVRTPQARSREGARADAGGGQQRRVPFGAVHARLAPPFARPATPSHTKHV